MSKINIKIEGKPYQVDEGLTIIDAARNCGYEIPSLCDFNHGECNQGSCRVCLVEVKGMRSLVASCVHPVSEGMEISISSPKAAAARRTSVELLLSNHSVDCQQCDKNGRCELLHVAKLTGARPGMFQGEKTPVTVDELLPQSFATRQNASSADAASQGAKTPMGSAFSASRTAASTPSSVLPETVPSANPPAYSADSA